MAAKSGANAAPTPGDWEEISPFTEARDMDTGDSFIATYLGGNELEVEDPNSEEPGGTRMTMFHEFRESDDSDAFGLWGSAGLDKRLSEVTVGTVVKVQYDGLVDIKGGRSVRQYRVWASRNQPL